MTLSHTATGVFHEINTYTYSGQTARIRLFYKHTPTCQNELTNTLSK